RALDLSREGVVMRAIVALLIALTASVAVIVIIASHGYRADRRAVQAERVLDAIRAALPAAGMEGVAQASTGASLALADSVRLALRARGATAAEATRELRAPEPVDGSPDLSRFKLRGLPDPAHDLRADLIAHPELI